MTTSAHEKIDRGHCLCNAVQFETRGDPIYNVICHCENCKRHGGSAFHTASIFLKSQYTLLPITDSSVITSYADEATQSGQPLHRQFCSICGSNIAALTPLNNDVISIPAGITERAGQNWIPQKEQFTKDKCVTWVPEFGEVSGLDLDKMRIIPLPTTVGLTSHAKTIGLHYADNGEPKAAPSLRRNRHGNKEWDVTEAILMD